MPEVTEGAEQPLGPAALQDRPRTLVLAGFMGRCGPKGRPFEMMETLTGACGPITWRVGRYER